MRERSSTGLRSTPTSSATCSCPLHIVHGTPDRIFRVDGARRIHAGARSSDKTLTEFPDGDHCVTNRSHEKHQLIADWFADRLPPGR